MADGAHHTNATYYNDVRVPVDMLVGKENDGWRLITTQLNNERVMLGPAGRFASIYDRVHAWASVPGGNGVTPIDHDDVKRALGEIRAIWRINELLNWQVASAGEDINMADAAATKVLAPSVFSVPAGSPRKSLASTATPPNPTPPSYCAGWTPRPSATW